MLHEERTVILAPANVKDKGVKKKTDYRALFGEAKRSFHSYPPSHCPLPTGKLKSKYTITPS